MQPQNPNIGIDLNLIDKIAERVPEWTWLLVKCHVVSRLVAEMPISILERLTGNGTDDDRAQEILDDYYAPANRNKDLLVDSFKIIGEEQTLYLLDALQLDKITEPTNNV